MLWLISGLFGTGVDEHWNGWRAESPSQLNEARQAGLLLWLSWEHICAGSVLEWLWLLSCSKPGCLRAPRRPGQVPRLLQVSLAPELKFILSSGFRPWGVPQTCPPGSALLASGGAGTHGELGLDVPHVLDVDVSATSRGVSLWNIWQSPCCLLSICCLFSWLPLCCVCLSPLVLLAPSSGGSEVRSDGEEQHSLKSLGRCHRNLQETEADVCICVGMEREAVVLQSCL